MDNLRQLPLAIWLAALAAVIILSVVIIWLRKRKFRLTKLIFKTPFVEAEVERGDTTPPAAQASSAQASPPGLITVNDSGPVQINQGADGRNIQTSRDYVEQQFLIQPQSPPTPGGFIPAPNVEIYIPRGEIEQEVRQRLQGGGVAAIVGVTAPGGVGKTELAKRAAHDLQSQFEAVLWVDVGEKTPSQVVSILAVECGLKFSPTISYSQQVTEVKALLQQHPTLVVLDDVRSVNAAALADFLPPSPPCAALITSRIQQFAALPTRACLPLDHMTTTQARALLEAVLTPARLQTELDAATRLMERCCYNPLALDIAVRRILQFASLPQPIAAFESRLQARLAELRLGDDPRLNLFAVFEVSYVALSQADQRRFRRLAVFAPAAGCSPQAAAAVWGEDEAETCDALVRLLNLSLLKPQQGPTERYRLHDLLDEYAAERLEESGESIQSNRAHAEFLIALFDKHYTDDPSNAPEVAGELDNLVSAARWALTQGDGNLLARLATQPRNWLYNVFRAWQDWQSWLTEALRLGIEDKRLRANVLQAIGDVQQFRDERDAALASYEQALGLFRAVGDRLGEANVLASQGQLYLLDDPQKADEFLERVIALYQQIGARYSVPAIVGNFGWALRRLGHKDRARLYLLRAADLFEKMGLLDYAERHRRAAQEKN